MRVAIHQPDFLPYSGFWHKMVTSDLFVLAVHDQFQKHGYQRRVTMRGLWCSHQLVGKPSLVPIESVRVAEGWQSRLADVIRGRHRGATHWRTRGDDLVQRILEARGESLSEVNVVLMGILRDVLGIRTPMTTTPPPTAQGRDRVLEQLHIVGATEYVSGSGARAYMGEDAEEAFAAEGVRLTWSRHRAITGDSIVTVLMDHADPMDVIAAVEP